MNATFTAPAGMGTWGSEAEFVENFNRTMADSGLSKRIKSAAELDTMRVSVPARTDMPSKVDRDSLPQRQGNGNTNTNSKPKNGATPKQTEWLIKMHNVKAENAEVDAITAKAVAGEFVSFDDAKKALDYVFDRSVSYRAKKVETPVAQPAAQTEKLTDGYYKHDGRFFKVQIAKHGSGNLYAKVFDTDTMSWEYAPGDIRKLSPSEKLSAEQAGEFGKLYGRCIKCSRELTDEASIAAGIGPICAGKM